MAPAEDDISIAEKRVYAGRAGRTDAYVATEAGIVRVAISGDKVGSFGLATREAAVDVAVMDRDLPRGFIAIATGDDLLVAPLEDPNATEERSRDDLDPAATGVGPTVAVGVHDGSFVAAGTDGKISRICPNGTDDEVDDGSPTVEGIGNVPDPRAVDGPLIAAGNGVHRVVERGSEPTVEHVGLHDVRDVAGLGIPLAATSDGLYWLGNGWMDALEGAFDAVAADGNGHAMAAAGADLYVRRGSNAWSGPSTGGSDDGRTGEAGHGSNSGWGADAWRRAELPVETEPIALGYGPGLSVAVTSDGTLCVDAGDGWRHQAIGVRGIGGVALTSATVR